MSDEEEYVENYSNKWMDSIYKELAEKRTLFLSNSIDAEIATDLIAKLIYLDSKSQTEEITIFINSLGGNIENGLFPIYDTMQFIKAPIRTISVGQSYSSAAIILAAGTPGRRFAFAHSNLMIHGSSGESSGTKENYAKELKAMKKLDNTMYRMLEKHTGTSLAKIKRDCKKDKYFTALEAKKYGLIDDIIGQPAIESKDEETSS